MITGDHKYIDIHNIYSVIIWIRHSLLPESERKHYALFFKTVYSLALNSLWKITRSPVLLNCESEIHSRVTFLTGHNKLKMVGCI